MKRIRTSSIKDDDRRNLNIILRKTSNELIDLIERMLLKDPHERIDMMQILSHPWVEKYKLRDEESEPEESEESVIISEEDEKSASH